MTHLFSPVVRQLPVAILFIFTVFFGVTAQAQSHSASIEVTGEASVVVFDDFLNDRSEIRYYIIEEKSKRERRLFFNDQASGHAPSSFKTGKKVRIRGAGRPDGVDVDSVEELDDPGAGVNESTPEEAALAAPETRKVLTLLVDFNDATVTGGSYGTTVQAVKDRMYNETKSVAGLFFNASLGTLTLDPDGDGDAQQDVFHVTINDSYIGGDSSQCSPSSWVSQASAAFEAATGKDVSIYRHRLLITPNYWDYGNRHCTWGGVAQVGCGSWCWAIGADPQSIMHGVIIHELGHNLSFNHARTDQNNNGYNSGESTDSEYGDNSDMMGSSRNWKKFNPPHAEDKGWVDPLEFEFREVTSGSSLQSFDLLPLDEEAWDWPGLRALKLQRSSNTDYYVTYRRQAGDYNNLNSPYHNRVNIYYGFDSNTYSYFVTALAAGESFTDAAQDFVITVTGPVPLEDGALSTTAMGVEICQQSCSSTPAPSSLSATAQSTSAIQLTWNDNSDDEDGFDIQRSPDGSSWSELITVAPESSSYTNTGLETATTYFYRVRASSPVEDSGWSNVASDQTFGIPPTADFSFFENFLDVDFTDLSNDSDGSMVAWSWNFGDGGSSSTQNPSHNYASAGSRDVSLTVTDDDGESDSVSKNVTVVEPPPPPFTDHGASGDIPVAGSVTGSYTATLADDGSVQSITERESGGKKNSRYSYGEHHWTFSLPSGGTEVMVSVNAWQSVSSDGDSFDFAWSPDGSNWTHMFNVAGTSDGVPVTFGLPAGTGGTVYIRVKDTDRTSGHRSKDTIYVDFLQIRVSNEQPEPLEGFEPTGLAATATSYETIELNWTDNTSNEAGFIIERSVNSGPFTELGSPAPSNGDSSASFTDSGLTGDKDYSYRVYAFKGEDSTAYSDTASETTGPAPAILLTLSGYKNKGKHTVELTWGGASSANVDIIRDGSVVATTENDGAFTDGIGSKGGATYTYQVCEAEPDTACSSEETVTF